jgi:sacsin
MNIICSPSFATVTKRLSQLDTEPPCASNTSAAIATLKFAVSLTLTESQLSQLLVPDDVHRLRPIQDVLFNDVGENSLLLPRTEACLASSSINDALAMALGLRRLGLKHAHLRTLGEDMGVTPATIVEKTLAQYTEKQFLPEFLANAQDAGASKLMVMINDYISVEGNFLSPALKTLHDRPSIMVYNDSEFSEQDFEGICKTFIGGKGNDPDSIGQFGLGALTMFHITEVSIASERISVSLPHPERSVQQSTRGIMFCSWTHQSHICQFEGERLC